MACEVATGAYRFYTSPSDPWIVNGQTPALGHLGRIAKKSGKAPSMPNDGPKVGPVSSGTPFRYGYLHDLESIWWIALWALFHHVPTDMDVPNKDSDGREFFDVTSKLFPSIFDENNDRFVAMAYSDTIARGKRLLPAPFRSILDILDNFRRYLLTTYSMTYKTNSAGYSFPNSIVTPDKRCIYKTLQECLSLDHVSTIKLKRIKPGDALLDGWMSEPEVRTSRYLRTSSFAAELEDSDPQSPSDSESLHTTLGQVRLSDARLNPPAYDQDPGPSRLSVPLKKPGTTIEILPDEPSGGVTLKVIPPPTQSQGGRWSGRDHT
jgi:hypothetical protein